MNKLIVTIDREDYASGLTGSFSGEWYSGFGKAWFNNSDVIQFCTYVQNLAESMDGAAELIGSVRKADGSEYLETFSLRCYVLSASKLNGIIGVHVTLADRSGGSDSREQEIFKMSGELQVRNHKLAEFSQNLKGLVNGSQNQVILNGDINGI
ncbi:MAG: hypothetical protein ACRBHB_02315 [Arenicella sp.]